MPNFELAIVLSLWWEIGPENRKNRILPDKHIYQAGN